MQATARATLADPSPDRRQSSDGPRRPSPTHSGMTPFGARLRVLRERGFLTGNAPTTEDVVLAMHRFLVATPARMLFCTVGSSWMP